MNILAVGAHPDDIEYGCGGAIARYARCGHSVSLLVLTRGGAGGRASLRAREQREAARVLGARRVTFGGYADTRLPLDKKVISFIEDVIARARPQIIFVHFPDDTHQDHRVLHSATLAAARYVPNLLFYEGPTSQNFSPTVFIDIAEVLEVKLAALRAHASQLEKTNIPKLNILDMALSTATFRGVQGRVTYAEGFSSARLFLNP